MPITQTFDAAYPDNPWSAVDKNQREWYDPELRDIYMREAVFSRFVTIQFPIVQDVRATKMHITSLIPPHANSDPIGVRQLWAPSSYMDSFSREIEFQRYGGKLALHSYDDLITYWKQNGATGLLPIIQKHIGPMMTRTMDKLARNAFFQGAAALGGYSIMGPDGSLTGFDDLNDSHTVTTDLIDSVHLGMGERGVPYARGLNGPSGNIICVTSPGVVYDLQREGAGQDKGNQWIPAVSYADAQRLVNGEVGMYHHIRFVQTPDAILYNCGEIILQATVTAAIVAGEGAPDPASTKVDGAKRVGQTGAAKRYIQLDPTTVMTDFLVNDIVTIHVDRTSAYGVTNGVDFTDGKLVNRRIVAVDAVNKRLSFDLPIMEDFDLDLGAGVYAYVTKAHHVHTMTFLGGADGIVMGVGQAPRILTPPPIDDFMSMHRVTWNGYFGYQLFEPTVYEVAFVSGPNRVKGELYRGIAAT